MTNEIQSTIALVNPYIACYYFKPDIESLFNQRFGEDRWTVYNNPTNVIPDELSSSSPGFDEEMFYNGMAFAQYLNSMQNNKININPIIHGILYAPTQWLNFLNNNSKNIVFYFDVDYETYLEVSEAHLADRDEYDMINQRLIEFTNSLLDLTTKELH